MLTDEDVHRACPRCASIGPHASRRSRYGEMLTCSDCAVTWLVPAVDVEQPKISATATWWRHE